MLLSDLSGPRELVPMAKLRINDASLPLLSPGISSLGKQRKLKKEKKRKIAASRRGLSPARRHGGRAAGTRTIQPKKRIYPLFSKKSTRRTRLIHFVESQAQSHG